MPGTNMSLRRSGDDDEGPRDTGNRFRTLCVRMCDGFHFPVSASTSRRGFMRDQMRCQATCGADARLFYVPATSLDMDDAVDLSGRTYASLKVANLHKKTMVAGCQCRPDPWSAAELSRHRQYADLEEPERAKAHASAIALLVADQDGTIEPAAAEPSGHEPAAAPSATPAAPLATPVPQPVPHPVPARRPPTLTAKPTPVARAAHRGPVTVRLTATPTQVQWQQRQQQAQVPSGLGGWFGGNAGSNGLTWPGDPPKGR
jgi:hypothetical protein